MGNEVLNSAFKVYGNQSQTLMKFGMQLCRQCQVQLRPPSGAGCGQHLPHTQLRWPTAIESQKSSTTSQHVPTSAAEPICTPADDVSMARLMHRQQQQRGQRICLCLWRMSTVHKQGIRATAAAAVLGTWHLKTNACNRRWRLEEAHKQGHSAPAHNLQERTRTYIWKTDVCIEFQVNMPCSATKSIMLGHISQAALATADPQEILPCLPAGKRSPWHLTNTPVPLQLSLVTATSNHLKACLP
eukprot:482552-Pelagomonas_calceolata.AAC.3